MRLLETLAPTKRATSEGTPARRQAVSSRATRGLIAILLGGVLSWACGGDAGLSDSQTRVRADLHALCLLEGDVPPLNGAPYDSAAAYTARVLENAGVLPGVESPEGVPGFIQPVPLVRDLVGDDTSLDLEIGGKGKRLPEGPRTFLLVAPGEAGHLMEARPPVFVGNGLHAPEYGVDDFAGLDLSGRGVMVTAAPPDSAALAQLPEPVRAMYADPGEAQRRRMGDIIDRGAAAIFLLPSRWLMDEWDAVSAEGSRPLYRPTEPYPGHVLRSPIPIALLHADLVDRIFLGREYHPISHVGQYRTFEIEDLSLRLYVDVRRDPLVTANVVGFVPGSDPALKGEYVVVSAQLDGDGADAWGPSSWDAAAAAAVLEVARSIGRTPTKRSVMFAIFIGDEGGIWGSLHLLTHAPVPPGAIVAEIHVGTGDLPQGSTLSLRALASPPGFAREVEGNSRGRHVEVRTASEAPVAFKGTPAGVALDAGIPSMLLTIPGSRWAWDSCDERSDCSCVLEATRLVRYLVDATANARRIEPRPPTSAERDTHR